MDPGATPGVKSKEDAQTFLKSGIALLLVLLDLVNTVGTGFAKVNMLMVSGAIVVAVLLLREYQRLYAVKESA